LQQFGESGGTGRMQHRADQHLSGTEIQVAGLVHAVEDDLQKALHLLRDLELDRFGRFFSCGERASSTGRARQIFSLTSSNCWLSSRNR
jgi:nucleoid DNA-binding protein